MTLPIHGTIRYIREILSEPSAHSSVRTFGTLVSSNFSTAKVEIEHDGKSLQVETDLLGKEISLKRGSLYMFIGEILQQSDGVALRARMARNVDGMDLELFATALKLRRDFEGKLAERENMDVVAIGS
mmetsp:Transcript_54505/g.128650  ORF Transcript_54505/g.128650 Transcript_54505/m.128650 type:complete len:128 (+) Transcript_54505:21-404(+)